jgi:hypothetical protein
MEKFSKSPPHRDLRFIVFGSRLDVAHLKRDAADKIFRQHGERKNHGGGRFDVEAGNMNATPMIENTSARSPQGQTVKLSRHEK